ncbi:hypothetical protein [Pseudomonas sp. R5(2019)]|uniref:hypothetical protein n=1 Tax=Pseudomonas sp. R5(2019) TaxID=2697566 RepID=UPI001411D1CC|nr:hypothetical protein [Pseudomonas sp. R5(2019)]NBA96853.1 hypothetical protein [Pseudomonas sp. R5(2019)]
MRKTSLMRYTLSAMMSTLLIAGNAQAYTCPELEKDNASERLKQPLQGGFTTVEEKISAVNTLALKNLTMGTAENIYKEYKAAGQLANPYQASLLAYEALLENEKLTNDLIEKETEKFGSLKNMALAFCEKKPDLQIERIYRSYFLTIQQK